MQPTSVFILAVCVEFGTAASFKKLDATSSLETVVTLLSEATEFSSSLHLRHNEKKALFAINSSKTLRFPIYEKEGSTKRAKIKTAANKVALLLQLRAAGHPLGEFHSAEFVLEQCGSRILNALIEYLTTEEKHADALHGAFVLRRSLHRSIGWHDDSLAGPPAVYPMLMSRVAHIAPREPFIILMPSTNSAGIRQLDGVGPSMSQKLHDASICSLQALSQQIPARIEHVCGKATPFGSTLVRTARSLLAMAPLITAEVGKVAKFGDPVPLTLRLSQRCDSVTTPPAGGQKGSKYGTEWHLLLSDKDKRVLLIRRIGQHQLGQGQGLTFTLTVPPVSASASLSANLVHGRLFGLDSAVRIPMPFAPETSDAPKTTQQTTGTSKRKAPKITAATGAAESKAKDPNAMAAEATSSSARSMHLGMHNLAERFSWFEPGRAANTSATGSASAAADSASASQAEAMATPTASTAPKRGIDLLASSDEEGDPPLPTTKQGADYPISVTSKYSGDATWRRRGHGSKQDEDDIAALFGEEPARPSVLEASAQEDAAALAAWPKSQCDVDDKESFWQQFAATPRAQSKAFARVTSMARPTTPKSTVAVSMGKSPLGALGGVTSSVHARQREVMSAGSAPCNYTGRVGTDVGSSKPQSDLVERMNQKMASMPPTPLRRLPVTPLPSQKLHHRCGFPSPGPAAEPLGARVAACRGHESASHAHLQPRPGTVGPTRLATSAATHRLPIVEHHSHVRRTGYPSSESNVAKQQTTCSATGLFSTFSAAQATMAAAAAGRRAHAASTSHPQMTMQSSESSRDAYCKSTALSSHGPVPLVSGASRAVGSAALQASTAVQRDLPVQHRTLSASVGACFQSKPRSCLPSAAAFSPSLGGFAPMTTGSCASTAVPAASSGFDVNTHNEHGRRAPVIPMTLECARPIPQALGFGANCGNQMSAATRHFDGTLSCTPASANCSVPSFDNDSRSMVLGSRVEDWLSSLEPKQENSPPKTHDAAKSKSNAKPRSMIEMLSVRASSCAARAEMQEASRPKYRTP